MKRPIILFLMFFLVFMCSYVRGELLNRVVAIVNDDLITLYELNKAIKERIGFDPIKMKEASPEDYLQARSLVLEQLINEKLTEEKIKELNIRVSSKEIDETIERIKSSNHWTHEDLLERLKEKGITYEKYRENIKKEIQKLKLINLEVKSKIIIREEQIEDYYKKHKDRFKVDEKVHIAVIFLKRNKPYSREELNSLYRKGEMILEKLKNGGDFASLAKEYSQGPGAQAGGDMGSFRMEQLAPEIRSVVKDMSPGEVSGLIVRPEGIQIIKVIDKQKGRIMSLNEVKDAIYQILYRDEVNRRFTSWIQELRNRSYIKIIF